MSYFTLTPEILTKVASLPRKARQKAMAVIGRNEFEHCSEDPIYWLDPSQHVGGMPYVYTKDPHVIYECKSCGVELGAEKRVLHLQNSHSRRETILTRELLDSFRELPAIRAFHLKEYMPPIIEWWQKSNLLTIEKSRDMMATWLIVAMSTWDVLFHKGRQHIFQSEDALKTLELVQRANIIYSNHPGFLKKAIGRAVYSKGSGKSGEFFVLDQESEILGFPQGANQIRQYHPTLVFTDETAFQAEAAAGFAAIKPSIQAGGKYIGVSSANRSFFEKLCKDQSEE